MHAELSKGQVAQGEGRFRGIAPAPVVRMEESGAATAPNFGGSHELITALAGNNPHGMTAAGRASPEVSVGRYRYEAAWRYLFGL